MKPLNGFHSLKGSTNQSINHQGRLTVKASVAATYAHALAKASALAGVEGYQLNPSQGAGLPILEVPAKGSVFEIRLIKPQIKRIANPPPLYNLNNYQELDRGVTRT